MIRKDRTGPVRAPMPRTDIDSQPHAITFFTTHAQRRAVLLALKQTGAEESHDKAPGHRTRALLRALGLAELIDASDSAGGVQ